MSAHLAFRHYADGDAEVVLAPEDLDVYTSAHFRRLLAELDLLGRRLIVIDLTGTFYADSTGLGVLLGARKRAVAQDGRVVLVTTSEHMLRSLRITGLLEMFTVCEDTAGALSAVKEKADA